MKNFIEYNQDDLYQDDFYYQGKESRKRKFAWDMVEQNDYSLESINFSEDGGISYSLRVDNLCTSDSYLIQKLVA